MNFICSGGGLQRSKGIWEGTEWPQFLPSLLQWLGRCWTEIILKVGHFDLLMDLKRRTCLVCLQAHSMLSWMWGKVEADVLLSSFPFIIPALKYWDPAMWLSYFFPIHLQVPRAQYITKRVRKVNWRESSLTFHKERRYCAGVKHHLEVASLATQWHVYVHEEEKPVCIHNLPLPSTVPSHPTLKAPADDVLPVLLLSTPTRAVDDALRRRARTKLHLLFFCHLFLYREILPPFCLKQDEQMGIRHFFLILFFCFLL